eukprot:gene16110-21890_t
MKQEKYGVCNWETYIDFIEHYYVGASDIPQYLNYCRQVQKSQFSLVVLTFIVLFISSYYVWTFIAIQNISATLNILFGCFCLLSVLLWIAIFYHKVIDVKYGSMRSSSIVAVGDETANIESPVEHINGTSISNTWILSCMIKLSCVLTTVLCSMLFIRKTHSGQCKADQITFMQTSTCNPFADNHGLPYEGISLLIIPLILLTAFQEIGFVTITISYTHVILVTCFYIKNVNAKSFVYSYAIHLILVVYMIIENRRQVLISFRLQSQLEVHILAQERQSEEQASELRHMIANV